MLFRSRDQQDHAAAMAQGLSEDQYQQIRQRNLLEQGQNILNGTGALGQQLGTSDGRIVTPQAPEVYTGTGQQIAERTGPWSMNAGQDDTIRQNPALQAANQAQLGQQGLGQFGAANPALAQQLGQIGAMGAGSLGQPLFGSQQDAAMQAAQQAQAAQQLPQPVKPTVMEDFNRARKMPIQAAGKGISQAPQNTMGMDQSVYANRGGSIGHYADGGEVMPGQSLLMMERK